MNLIKNTAIILVLFIFLISFASAIIYESYLETADIKSKDKIHETIEIFININESQNSINFFLVPDVSNLQVFFDDKEINCNVKTKIGSSEVLCNFEKSLSGKHFLKAEFDSSYPLIKINQGRLMFRSSYDPLIETKKFIFILKLPLGYIIPEEPGKDKLFFISPSPKIIYSDGQRIILRWEEKLLDEKFDVSVISEELTEPINVLTIILAFILVIVILFLFFYFKKKFGKEKQFPKRRKAARKLKKDLREEILEEHLMESEKKIMGELKNADKKELWQKQLQLKTEFSKAKLSRVIRNLESRNLIQKIPFGKTNKIKLKIK